MFFFLHTPEIVKSLTECIDNMPRVTNGNKRIKRHEYVVTEQLKKLRDTFASEAFGRYTDSLVVKLRGLFREEADFEAKPPKEFGAIVL